MSAEQEAMLLLRVAGLNAAYAAAIDGDRLEDWPGFFVADCLYTITSEDNLREGNQAGIVYADSRGMLADRILALRRANIFERHRYCHVIGIPTVRRGPSALEAEAPFVVIRTMRDGRMDVFAAGRYRDRLVELDDGLRFQQRMVVCDSSHFDTLLAIPL